jgi:hypothetical protein
MEVDLIRVVAVFFLILIGIVWGLVFTCYLFFHVVLMLLHVKCEPRPFQFGH